MQDFLFKIATFFYNSEVDELVKKVLDFYFSSLANFLRVELNLMTLLKPFTLLIAINI